MPEDIPENREIRLKKLRFRGRHMGTAENDAIFGGFADTRLAALSDDQLDRFEDLLAENDGDLYNWISGLKEPPENRKTDVFQMILDFKYHL